MPGLGPLEGHFYSAVAAALTAGSAPGLGSHTQEFYALFEQQAAAVSSTREVRRFSLAWLHYGRTMSAVSRGILGL